jgi:UDPglucose 6-dehydrogenase
MTVIEAEERGLETPLLAAVGLVNLRQRTTFVDRVEGAVGDLTDRRIALLGLTFKPNTDDLRAAPSLDIATDLLARGAQVVAFDPMPAARERAAMLVPGLEVVDTALGAVTGADAIALLTEWPECVALPWDTVASLVDGRVIVDGRNAIDPEVVAAAGFEYIGFGRGRLRLQPGVAGVGVMDVETSRVGQAIVVGES